MYIYILYIYTRICNIHIFFSPLVLFFLFSEGLGEQTAVVLSDLRYFFDVQVGLAPFKHQRDLDSKRCNILAPAP